MIVFAVPTLGLLDLIGILDSHLPPKTLHDRKWYARIYDIWTDTFENWEAIYELATTKEGLSLRAAAQVNELDPIRQFELTKRQAKESLAIITKIFDMGILNLAGIRRLLHHFDDLSIALGQANPHRDI